MSDAEKLLEPNLDELIRALREKLPDFRRQYRIRTLALFGSFVRKEQTAASDLDVLVTFEQPPSLLGFLGLENRLHDLLGIQVDLVMEDSLRPRIRERILNEALYL